MFSRNSLAAGLVIKKNASKLRHNVHFSFSKRVCKMWVTSGELY